MSMLKDIHDYVKKNYEAGNYDDAKAAYTSWKTENNQQSNLTDFEMGIQKAQSDYKKSGTFAIYPKLAIDVANNYLMTKLLKSVNLFADIIRKKKKSKNIKVIGL